MIFVVEASDQTICQVHIDHVLRIKSAVIQGVLIFQNFVHSVIKVGKRANIYLFHIKY